MQARAKFDNFIVIEECAASDFFLNLCRIGLEFLAGLRQCNLNGPAIRFVLDSPHEARLFKSIDDRGYRVSGKQQVVGDFAESARIVLPQNQHHEKLWIGEAEVVQERSVGPCHSVGGGIKRKAQLIGEASGFATCFALPVGR